MNTGEKPDPDEAAVESIAASVRQVVLDRAPPAASDAGAGQRRSATAAPRAASAMAFRDVHVKHHGLLCATFEVLGGIDEKFKHGVFADPLPAGQNAGPAVGAPGAPRAPYKAWVRFSSSNTTPQSDAVADGRGIGVKLLEVPDEERLLKADDQPKADDQLKADDQPKADDQLKTTDQPRTQDFVALNGRAFFARNAEEMVIVARLQAADQFPSTFFLPPSRWSGLAALLEMANNQADSPLDLTYWSQTPYLLGANLVKYRLRPENKPGPPASPLTRLRPNYLFESLVARIQSKSASEVAFLFEVQLAQPGDDPDDATAIWDEATHPFVAIGRLRILPQSFATKERMDFAEVFSFNPFNGLKAFAPQGSINRARGAAYRASAAARKKLNESGGFTLAPLYTVKEWEEKKADPGNTPFVPPSFTTGTIEQVLNGIAHVFPQFGVGLHKFLTSSYALFLAPALLAVILWYGCCVPGGLVRPFEAPLSALLDSESLIPRSVPLSTGAENAPVAPDGGGDDGPGAAEAMERHRRWEFRYGPIGTEANAGLPYWVWRALPKLFPARFDYRGDYSLFGFDTPDDPEFYTDYHDMPRGFILTDDDVYSLGGTEVGIKLKRVALNCATCHRGEYIGPDRKAHFADGMPSQRLDTAGYQRAVFESVLDDQFNVTTLVPQINKLLAEEYNKLSPADQKGKKRELSPVEVAIYAQIIDQMKTTTKGIPIGWKFERPENGPGRLDAFGALRYEFLPQDPSPPPGKLPIATVDLPSLWHQGPDWRPWHHWDGNTADAIGRSYGAAIGVGAVPLSIRRYDIADVSNWIDSLAPPPYPFFPEEGSLPRAAFDRRAADGEKLYDQRCQSCHGHYDGAPGHKKLAALTPCMLRHSMAAPDFTNKTDEERTDAVDPAFVANLNKFGAANGLWNSEAFESAGTFESGDRKPRDFYQCPPLDGIWARAPYLHNGSVPTLQALLSPAIARPVSFFRGSAHYLQDEGGFDYKEQRVVKATSASGAKLAPLFRFDVSKPGNGNGGHTFDPNPFTEDDVMDLITYLYTL